MSAVQASQRLGIPQTGHLQRLVTEAVHQLDGGIRPAVVPSHALQRLENEAPLVAPVAPAAGPVRGGYWSAVVHGSAGGAVLAVPSRGVVPSKRRLEEQQEGSADSTVTVAHSQIMDSLSTRLKRLRQRDAAYEEWLLHEAIRGEGS